MSTRNVYVFTMAGTDLETPAAKARDSRGVAWSMISVCPLSLINLKYHEGGVGGESACGGMAPVAERFGPNLPAPREKNPPLPGVPKMKNLQLASKMIKDN